MKKVLKFLWNEFIYGGHSPAVSTVIMAFTACYLLGYPQNYFFYFIIYLITYLVYGFDFLIDNKKPEKRIRFQLLLASVILLLVLLRSTDNIFFIFTSLLLPILGILYNVYFKRITKDVTGFKSLFVALLFPSSFLLIALFFSNRSVIPLLFVYLFFFSRVLANTIFCDIKDISEDSNNDLKTFPVLFGEYKTTLGLILINIFSIVPLIIGIHLKYLPYSFLSLICVPVYALLYLSIYLRHNKKINEISVFAADGESLVWLILAVIGGYIK